MLETLASPFIHYIDLRQQSPAVNPARIALRSSTLEDEYGTIPSIMIVEHIGSRNMLYA